jgi:hypothetical protein
MVPLITPLLVSPDAVGPFIAPCQQESSPWIDLSLSLRAVRMITEWEDLKDGLQEVPKCDNWPRRHFSFPGNFCLHLRDISTLGQLKKPTKTQFPTWPMGPPVSGSLCMAPCSLSLLLSTYKIFPISAAQVLLCFLRTHPRTLNSWKFLCVVYVSLFHRPFLEKNIRETLSSWSRLG